MRSLLLGTCGAIALALGGCASTPHFTCAAGERAMRVDTYYFGTGIPGGGTVSETEWSTFVGEVVTPRFPEGLTTWQASGQWRGASGVVEREGTHVLRLAHPDDAAHERAAAEVAAAYKTRFRQESVMRERAHVCTSF